MSRSRLPDCRDACMEAARNSGHLTIDEVVRQLTAALTRPVVAIIAGERATAVVSGWERGTIVPGQNHEHVLRLALEITHVLRPRYGSRSIITWLCGANPRLESQSPADVLARLTMSYAHEDADRVLAAAQAFSSR